MEVRKDTLYFIMNEAYNLSLNIREKHPEIYRGYFKYKSFFKFAKKLQNSHKDYSQVNTRILAKALNMAILGFSGNEFHDGYDSMISEDVYLNIVRGRQIELGLEKRDCKVGFHDDKYLEVRSEFARIGGFASKGKRTGYHGLTKEENYEYGKLGGMKTLEEGLGVFGRSKKQHSLDSKLGAAATNRKRGFVSWIEAKDSPTGIDEIDDVIARSKLKEYCDPRGVSLKKLVTYTNEVYHGGMNVRNVSSLSKKIVRRKAELEKQAGEQVRVDKIVQRRAEFESCKYVT